MTAYKVVDDHNELLNIGSTTHDQIDTFISGTAFLIYSGSNNLPPNAKQLTAGAGLTASYPSPNVVEFSVDVAFTGNTDAFAEYVVLNPTSSLPNAKALVTGSGIIISSSASEVSITVDQSFIRSMFVFQEVPTGDIDGMNSDFVLQSMPAPTTSLMFYVNGMLQAQGPSSDYVLSGTTVSLAWTPRSGSNIFASYPRAV